MQVDRAANWSVWANVPNAKLWEAVALSLNIDPRKVQHAEHQYLAGPTADRMFDETQTFKDRMLIARRNIGSSHDLKPTSIVMGKPEDCSVNLRDFGAWAALLGWELPEQFPQEDLTKPRQGEIDPADLPEELDCANQAFRAVHNGYGNQSTIRKRLLAWVNEHYPQFGEEARNRIATVANSDKTPGRSKGSGT